jgi:hypothetical protein
LGQFPRGNMADTEFTPEELSMIEADRTGAEIAETTEEAPAAETQETQEEAKEVVKPPEGFVPHGALHEERARRKELQKELQDYREKFARVDEQVKMLSQKKAPETSPNYDEDPLGYSKYEIERLKSELSNVTKQTPENISNLEQKIELMNLQRSVERQEMTFEKDNPDYRDALTFYAKSRSETLMELGYESDEVHGLVAQELQDATHRAIQSGKNPAEVVYKMSKRSGYAGKKVSETETSSKKLDTLKKAEGASKSLSDTGGKNKGELSAEALAEMSDDDFSKLSDDDFRKAMGG